MNGPEHLCLSSAGALDLLATRAVALAKAAGGQRIAIGIAGGPGAGKSTLAQKLVDRLNADMAGVATVVPLDGFHMRQAKLDELGLAGRKGAPETFEAEAFIAALKALKQTREPSALPGYDRAIEDVVEGAVLVPGAADILVVEGNYLLMASAPWWPILPLLDLAVHLDVSRAVVAERLARRHAEHGRFTPEHITRHIDSVDLPNYDRIARGTGRAQIVLALTPEG
jgi:pantothenate kinase